MKNFYNILLKLTFLSLFIGLYTNAGFAATYYVSNTGNDGNSGLSTSLPWQSLSKVNSVNLMAGDQVLFQRGNTFYGSLTIKNSGASGSPILLGAYGTGSNPIITGFTSVGSWTSLGGNIWESTGAVSTLANCNMVAINGINTPMGRYPNANATNGGYLTFQSHVGNTSITSSSLTGTPNWTGATIALRSTDYTLDRLNITSQSGGTLTFPGAFYELINGFGFFIQNDARTLDSQNEWYYDPSTKKIKIFSTTQPANVKVASQTNLLTVNGDYVTINGIDFTGANGSAIYNQQTTVDHVNITNCNISFSGINGITFRCDYMNIENNTFLHSNNTALSIWYATNSTVKNNTIQYSGFIAGMGASGYGSSRAIDAQGAANLVIEGNIIANTGYIGILFYGENVTVRNNVVDTYCTVLQDGGGIYTWVGAQSVTHNGVISGNIVINGVGAVPGTTSPSIAHGIYLDDYAKNVEVYDNTTAFNSARGIYLHNAAYINLHNNTSYNNGLGQLLIDDSGGGLAGNGYNLVSDNIFFSLSDYRQVVEYRYTFSDLTNIGTFSRNCYARPLAENLTLRLKTSTINFVDYTLSGWQTLSGKDAGSYKSPLAITSPSDVQFEYNATKTAKTIALSRPMMDVKGTKYNSSVTLQPYTSVVLMKDPNATTVVLPILFNVTGGGSYTAGGSGVPVGLSGSQSGVNYQLKLDGVNSGSVVAGTGSSLSFGNKTVAGTYTVVATNASTGSTATMTGSAIVIINSSSTTVTGVSVSPTSASISVNATQQLTATVLPSNATNKTVTWSSSNTLVATVNSVGLVTGVAPGSAVITVKTQDGSKTASSTITVSSSTGSTGSTIGSNVIGSTSETGDSGYLVATKFTATSNMTVNRINLYAGQASGTARMAIFTSNSTGEPAALLAQTGDISLITGWNSGTLAITQNLVAGATYWLTFELSSSLTQVCYTASYGASRYKSFAYGPFPSTAPVCNVGGGIYSIYADNDGVAASIMVTGVSVSPTSASISVNATQQLTATVLPSNATNKTVTWSSSNTLVATVNSVGLVTGVAPGSAVITVKTQDGSKTASSSITVNSVNNGTIGSKVIGSTSETGDNGYLVFTKFNATSNMSVNRINLYAGQASGTARMAIYTSNSTGEPGTLLAQTGDISLITGWNSGNLASSQNLVAGATYWLTFELSSSLTQVRYTASYGASRYKSFAYGPFPSTAPVSSIGGGIYSIYADNNGLKSGNIDKSAGVTGIEDISQQTKIDVFPNPSKGNITVHFSTLPEVESRIEITDISGRIITTRPVSANDERFNLDQQPNGIYFVKSIIGSSATVQKLILNK